MTGISEILVLVLLIASILILPRIFKGAEPGGKSSLIELKKMGVKTRLGIILTIVYPVAMALYLKPWNENLILYISCGILPAFLGWGVVWVVAGRKE